MKVGSTSSGDVFVRADTFNFNRMASDTGAEDNIVIWTGVGGHGINGRKDAVKSAAMVSRIRLGISMQNVPMFLFLATMSRSPDHRTMHRYFLDAGDFGPSSAVDADSGRHIRRFNARTWSEIHDVFFCSLPTGSTKNHPFLIRSRFGIPSFETASFVSGLDRF